jgi:hypothetical protein
MLCNLFAYQINKPIYICTKATLKRVQNLAGRGAVKSELATALFRPV